MAPAPWSTNPGGISPALSTVFQRQVRREGLRTSTQGRPGPLMEGNPHPPCPHQLHTQSSTVPIQAGSGQRVPPVRRLVEVQISPGSPPIAHKVRQTPLFVYNPVHDLLWK